MTKNLKVCNSVKCDFPEYFWQSLDVWIYKPHVLNKKIGAADVLEIGKSVANLSECINYFKENICYLKRSELKENLTALVENYQSTKRNCELSGDHDLFLRIIYPKTGGYFLENIDIIVKDYHSKRVTFMKPVEISSNISPVTVPYTIVLDDIILKLLIPDNVDESEPLKWLGVTLLPKLAGWMKPELAKTPTYSHKLIPADKYISVYNELKRKYFKSIQEIWTESTNPQKFIIEDLAIASYLLVLWEGKCQRFVDLGCGNGLLVHILNSENHQGAGLDVRARKIWESYPATTVLKESVITPSLECRFDNVDWIIGNHSDELTPWIPVISAKSDYTTNFFLLPCCLFEFNGSKYARNCSKKSCYEEYMDYIEQVCQICGFNIERDRMKIPSTKRNCFVSKGRSYPENKKYEFDKKIDNFVNSKMNNNNEIKIRDFKEKVQNCTQLDKEFLNCIVSKIAKYILNKSNDVESWKEGEFTDLKEIVELIPPEDRQKLKNECGGLQTLLKNHYHIFLVLNGKVKLRKPTKRNVPPHQLKKKHCWFFAYHPSSCPLSDEDCSYIHKAPT